MIHCASLGTILILCACMQPLHMWANEASSQGTVDYITRYIMLVYSLIWTLDSTHIIHKWWIFYAVKSNVKCRMMTFCRRQRIEANQPSQPTQCEIHSNHNDQTQYIPLQITWILYSYISDDRFATQTQIQWLGGTFKAKEIKEQTDGCHKILDSKSKKKKK